MMIMIQTEIQRAAQTVLGVYLKRTCSRFTSESSALAVLNQGCSPKKEVGTPETRLEQRFV